MTKQLPGCITLTDRCATSCGRVFYLFVCLYVCLACMYGVFVFLHYMSCVRRSVHVTFVCINMCISVCMCRCVLWIYYYCVYYNVYLRSISVYKCSLVLCIMSANLLLLSTPPALVSQVGKVLPELRKTEPLCS